MAQYCILVIFIWGAYKEKNYFQSIFDSHFLIKFDFGHTGDKSN